MKISYYVQRYRPAYEAISKEVKLLADHFSVGNEVTIHNLHLDGLFNFAWRRRTLSAHFIFYPLLFPLTWRLSRRSNLNHIYTSLGDTPYLPLVDARRTILTAAASCSLEKVKRRLPLLQKLLHLVVESERHRRELLQLGLGEEKVSLIYPPVDLKEFRYVPALGPFTILYASCPTRAEDFEKRGINLIIDTVKVSKVRFPKVRFHLAWRKGAWDEIQTLIKGSPQITATNEIIKNMNMVYAQAHATIIPYTRYDDFLKLIPNSALESLAAGKPILVSRHTELAKVVETEGCGVVFEPTVAGLSRGIQELRDNYHHYQKHCRKAAALFSQKRFLKEYEKLYNEVAHE